MYAVIRTGGKQYRVGLGDVVKVESVVAEANTVELTTCWRSARDREPLPSRVPAR